MVLLVLKTFQQEIFCTHTQPRIPRRLVSVAITAGNMLDLGTITLEEDQSIEQQSSIITLMESDFSDENNSSENTSGLLQSSRDAFASCSFQLGTGSF
jgi:hypothetical protein